jgi:hypothetical protein
VDHHPGCGVTGSDRVGQPIAGQFGAELLGQAKLTTRHEARSITVASYSQPSQVQM